MNHTLTTLPARRIPVILDTDIGDDIDDTWALALLLRSPELEVKLVTTATGDTTYRARLTARLLEVAGRTDVPVGIGPAGPVRTPPRQTAWIEGYSLERYPGKVHADGVQAMIDVIMGSPDPVTLISICPLTNIAAALRREPRIAARTHFVGMQGSIREHMKSNLTVMMGEGACAEWNVVSDISASQAVFSAPWLEATLSPVDTCARIVVDGERYQRLLAGTDPLLRALLENYRLWSVTHGDHGHPDAQSSVLFDCEAVHLAHTTRWLRMRRMGVRVDDAGYTREDAAARPFNVALAWDDYGAFADDLTTRLLVASTSPESPEANLDRRTLIFDGQSPDKLACDTTLRLMADGSWVMVMLGGGDHEPRPENHVFITRSLDQGANWSPLVPLDLGFPRHGDTIALVPSELMVYKGTCTLFVATRDGTFAAGAWKEWMVTSTDSCRTFNQPVPAPGRLHERTFIRNHIVTRDGRLLLPFQHYRTTRPPEKMYANVVMCCPIGSRNGTLMSSDGGRTWTEHGDIRLTPDDNHHAWAENNIVELADGRIAMIIRADGLGGVLYYAESTDGGRTWPEFARKTDIPNPGSKATFYGLGGDTVALLHNPNPQHRSPLALWISCDGLKTWPYRRVLVFESCDGPNGWLNYPDGFVSADRQWLHFAFDDNRHRAVFYGATLPPLAHSRRSSL